jgi:hypothetical protein
MSFFMLSYHTNCFVILWPSMTDNIIYVYICIYHIYVKMIYVSYHVWLLLHSSPQDFCILISPTFCILTHIRTGGLNHRACAGVDTWVPVHVWGHWGPFRLPAMFENGGGRDWRYGPLWTPQPGSVMITWLYQLQMGIFHSYATYR